MTKGNPFQSPATTDGQSPNVTRRSWLPRLFLLGASGLASAFLGLVYGVVMVGVPYQDPTPAMARREALHSAISGWCMTIGCCLMLFATLGIMLVFVARGIKRVMTPQANR